MIGNSSASADLVKEPELIELRGSKTERGQIHVQVEPNAAGSAVTVLRSEKRGWTEVWAAWGRGWQQLWKDSGTRGLRSFFKYMESKGATRESQ